MDCVPDELRTTRPRLTAPEPWQEVLARVLSVAGLSVAPQAVLGLSVGSGRVVPREVHGWTVDSASHLLVAAWPHGIEVRPWVLPGIGPCARCVVAATLDVGECRALPALAPDLLPIAAGWVARDVAAWQQGQVPSTWSTSWFVDANPLPRSRHWGRHAYCGCAWFEIA